MSKALGKHLGGARKQTILEAPAVYSKFLFVYVSCNIYIYIYIYIYDVSKGHCDVFDPCMQRCVACMGEGSS